MPDIFYTSTKIIMFQHERQNPTWRKAGLCLVYQLAYAAENWIDD